MAEIIKWKKFRSIGISKQWINQVIQSKFGSYSDIKVTHACTKDAPRDPLEYH